VSYVEKSRLFKALGNPIRLEIVDMIACSELCACEILNHFDMTQPTLSHHLKVLCESGLVDARKQGKWVYYSLSKGAVQSFVDIMTRVSACNEVYSGQENQCCGGEVREY